MKILIVDDELLAREVLKTQLEVLHYQNIEMAGDGASALLSLSNETPDVIFLDICMPEMSGIEFMEQAAKCKKDIIYIILSGYDVFEYAQRAIELGAYKYLLKPVDTQTLKQTMLSVETMISKQSQEEERYADLNKKVRENQSILRRRYLYEWVSGASVFEQKMQISFSYKLFRIGIIAMETDNGQEKYFDSKDQMLIQFGVENILTEIANQHGMDMYFFSDGRIEGFLVNCEDKNPKDEYVYRKMYMMIQQFLACFNFPHITMGVGKEVSQVDNLFIAYSSAQEAFKQKLTKGNNQLFFAEEQQLAARKTNAQKVDLEVALLQSLYQEDSAEMNNCIKTLHDLYLSEEYTDIKQLGKMHLNVFVLLHKELEKRGIESSTILEDEFLLYRKIQAMDHISDMQSFLYEKMKICKEAIQKQGGTGHEKIMIRAKEYIRQNMGYDLTLESTAEHVNFSPTYFSRFFKSEEGMNFIDYVTKMRIEEAKELLSRNVKTVDICNKIGFRDVKHFYKIFKKVEGITPGQYKNGSITK